MRKTLTLVLLGMIAVGMVPAMSSADHCDRSGRGNEQIGITSGGNGLPGAGPVGPFPNGILGHGSTRYNLGTYGCDLEDPGYQDALRRAGQSPHLPTIYDEVNTNWITPGATHFQPWATMDNGCTACERPASFVYQIDRGSGFGSEIAVPSVIWDVNNSIFRSRNPISMPSDTTRIRVEAYVDNTNTPDDTTDKVTVSRIYGVCRDSFGSGGGGLAAPALNLVPRTRVCMPA